MIIDAIMHQNDTGTSLRIRAIDEDAVPIDISAATSKSFLIKNPSGVVVSVTAGFLTDGTDGWLQYTIDDEFDEEGVYEVQARLVFGTGTWSLAKARVKALDALAVT